ncbi:hypothetical protein GF362_04070 [Candidatus Dojkabacteria bacterium]|nr:hypothetical protein [Candidatus Dojkabacteria bacterium]
MFIFFHISSIKAQEDQAYLDCVCKCSCLGIGKDVSSTYDTENYSGSPSCADPANGPCKCSGFGCYRTQFDDTSECAQKCSQPNCASNETPNAGNVCVCATDSCCTSKYGESYYDSSYLSTNEDTCRPKEGAVWDASLQKFVYPPCGGDYTRHSNGICICADESCCDRLFGANSTWNGDGDDGCGCAGGSVWTGSKCLCQSDSCCQALWGDAIHNSNETNSGCSCMAGAVVQNDLCVCGLDYTASFEQRECICGDDGCCQRIFGAAHYNYGADDGCECNSNASWVGSKCVVTDDIDVDDSEDEPTMTPPDDPCTNGDKDEGEEGVDCGGICEASCEWSITLNPQEIEMTADGVTKQEFIVRVIVNGETSENEELKVSIEDENNKIEDDKEGSVDPKSGKTNSKGEFRFTYKTDEQYIDFEGGYVFIKVEHKNGSKSSKIKLIPSVSVNCGNWECEERETNANCPSDCARNVSYQQALEEIRYRYSNHIKLNPYYPEGTASFQLYFTGMRNNAPKGFADAYSWFFQKLESGGGWIGEKLNLGKPDLTAVKNVYDKISQQYDPYTCGSFQTKITHMFNSMRWSNDATERKIISYFDYSPVTTNIPAHEAVMIYPKGTNWEENGMVLDPWLMNNHNVYPMKVWSGWGIVADVACAQHPYYPACNKEYRMPDKMVNKLNSSEQKFYDSLSSEMRNRIDSSLSSIQNKINKSKQERNFELASKYENELINHKSYIIQELIYSRRFNKVEVIVDCPVRVLVTDNTTGKKVGIDKEGNLINEIPELLPDLRLLNEQEIFSYFTLPKDGDYTVEMFGIDSGKAEIHKSIPNGENQFETYSYTDIPISTETSANFDFSSTEKGADIKIGEKTYKAEKEVVDSKLGSVDATLNFISDFTERRDEGVGGYIQCTDSSLGIWGVFLICGGLLVLSGGIVLFIILRKDKKTRIIGIIFLILGVCIGCSLSSISIFSWLIGDGGVCPADSSNEFYGDTSESSPTIETQNDEGNNSNTYEQTEDPANIPDPEVMGFVENSEYNYSVFLGEFAPNVELKETNPEWALASFDYCIQLEEARNSEDINCGKGEYGLFNISVLNDEQYQIEVTDSPMGDLYETLYQGNNQNIVFSHPNGAIPQELSLPEDFYEEVIDSFTIISNTSSNGVG